MCFEEGRRSYNLRGKRPPEAQKTRRHVSAARPPSLAPGGGGPHGPPLQAPLGARHTERVLSDDHRLRRPSAVTSPGERHTHSRPPPRRASKPDHTEDALDPPGRRRRLCLLSLQFSPTHTKCAHLFLHVLPIARHAHPLPARGLCKKLLPILQHSAHVTPPPGSLLRHIQGSVTHTDPPSHPRSFGALQKSASPPLAGSTALKSQELSQVLTQSLTGTRYLVRAYIK